MTRVPPLAYFGAALVASYILGAAIAAATDLGSFGDILTNGTLLSAPFYMLVLESLAVVAVVRGRRIGAFVFLAVSGLSLIAAAFDGDLGYATLSTGQVAWQVLEVSLSAIVFAQAAAELTRTRSRPAVA